MRLKLLGSLAFLLGAATMLVAQSGNKVERVPLGDPAFPISGAVVVPPGYGTIYLSGTLPKVADPKASKGTIESYGDTKTQTISVLQQIQDMLAKQRLSMADVVMMHVYLAGDPKKDGKMDFAGMMDAYKQFFGTSDQPNKPSRSTVQVAGLVAPGALVEIDVIAVRKHQGVELVH